MTSQTNVAGQAAATTEHIATTPSASRPLLPSEMQRGLTISIWEGAIANIHISITGAIGGSVFLSGFAILLGANNFQIGLLGALPYYWPALSISQRLPRSPFRQSACGCALFSAVRPVGLGISALAAVYWLADNMAINRLFHCPWLFLWSQRHGRQCVDELDERSGAAQPTWQLFWHPQHGRRDQRYGQRLRCRSCARLVSRQWRYSAGLCRDFGVAVLAAFGAAVLIARQPEPPITPRPWSGVSAFLFDPLREASFRHFTMLATGWALVTGIAAPFFNAYGLTALRLDFSLLALMGVVTNAVALIFSPLVGWLMDRYGYRLVVTACVMGTIPLPLGWILSTPDNIVPLWLTSIFSGVFWPGANQGLGNLLMARAPAEQRGAAMAIFSLLTGLGTLLASLAGGTIGQAMTGVTVALGPLAVSGLAMLFVLTMLGRMVMVGAFWRVLES